MKIFIQGRKDGYKILYPRPTPDEFFYFARDIQSASAKSGTDYFGKSIYAIAFSKGGCIFSKYFIGFDFERKDTGYIGVSIFIPNQKKLSGVDIKSFLDDLLQTYHFNYIDGHTISNRTEEWHLFSSLIDKFKGSLIDCEKVDGFMPGEREAAFFYYNDESLLISVFDSPFQPDYSDFKEVFFVSEKYKQSGSPLDIFKNSGIEIKLDFSNEILFLNIPGNSNGLKISADGKPRSGKQTENQIRYKSKIDLTYCTDDRCFTPGSISGRLSDSTSDINKYLNRNGKNISVNFESLKELQIPREKRIRFFFKTYKGDAVSNVNISVNDDNRHIDKEYYDHVFCGNELIDKIQIKAIKDSKHVSANNLVISPFSTPSEYSVILNHTLNFTVQAICDGDLIFGFNYTLSNGKTFSSDCALSFSNEDLDSSWTIKVQKLDNDFEYVGTLDSFVPLMCSSPNVVIPCNKVVRIKSNKNRFPISAGKNGKKSEICPDFSTSKWGADLKSDYIIANQGFKFSGWEFIDGNVTAQYEKTSISSFKKWSLYFFVALFVIVVFGALSYDFIKTVWNKPTVQRYQDTTLVTPTTNSEEDTLPRTDSNSSNLNNLPKDSPPSPPQITTPREQESPQRPELQTIEVFKDSLFNNYFEIGNLENAKRNNGSNRDKAINLYIEFWNLNGNGGNDYSSFQRKLENDAIAKQSKLKKAVDNLIFQKSQLQNPYSRPIKESYLKAETN